MNKKAEFTNNNYKNIWSILWLIVIVLLLITIIYFFTHISDTSFINNSMGNLFATVIGVLIGVPIGLKINREQQKAQDIKESDARDQIEKNQKIKILKLIKGELEFNRGRIGDNQPNLKNGETQRKISLPGMKDELWNAFSDGGELEWINDVELLDVICNAYYRIRVIIYLEGKFFDILHYPSMKGEKEKDDSKTESLSKIISYFEVSDNEARKHIELAIKEIEKVLDSTQSTFSEL